MIEQHVRFTGEVTKYIKGFAIILMICNHLYPIPEFIFPENQYLSIAIGSKTLAAYVGGFGKICVAIYTILAGIGLYSTYSRKEKAYQHTLKKLIVFYLSYWLILLGVFVPVMSLAGVWDRDWLVFIKNMVGYETSYCKVAWYVFFYMELIITFPFYVMIFKRLHSMAAGRRNIAHILFIGEVICLVVLRAAISRLASNSCLGSIMGQYLNYVPLALLGYHCAEYGVFEKLVTRLNNVFIKRWQVFVISGISFSSVFLLRGGIKEIYYCNLDIVYAPIIITILFVLKKYLWNVIDQIIAVLGQYSTELWFLHAIFFIGSAWIQKIAYWPKIDILILIWTVIILLPFAWLIQKITGRILSLVNKRIMI